MQQMSSMHTDVAELRDFYLSPLGLVVRRVLAQKIRAKWQRQSGYAILGYGFATPFLGPFRGEAARLGALMPATQGALVWPSADRNMSALVDEGHLPVADNSVDRLLVVHGLEIAERPGIVLRELWRVLAPDGRILVIVPNRTGVWARTDRTPFGQGRPYSSGQLDHILREAMFTPLSWTSALYLPPVGRGLVLRSAAAIERIGSRGFGRFAGVIIVEATKELVAPIGTTAPVTVQGLRIALPASTAIPNGGRIG